MKKIIFIDFENVLEFGKKFRNNKMNLLIDLISKTDSKVVVFGKWRKTDFNMLFNMLKDNSLSEDIINNIISCTSDFRKEFFKDKHLNYSIVEGNEIKYWIYNNLEHPYLADPDIIDKYRYTTNGGLYLGMKKDKEGVDYQYVIITSNKNLLMEQEDKSIIVNKKEGLTLENVNIALNILNTVLDEKSEPVGYNNSFF